MDFEWREVGLRVYCYPYWYFLKVGWFGLVAFAYVWIGIVALVGVGLVESGLVESGLVE